MKKVSYEKLDELDYRARESYKALRTNIQFLGDDIQTIAFTSATPNEGKSTVSFELAKTFCEDSKKVLYIDADIRKSVLLNRHGVDAEVNGLSHYLSGQKELQDIIYETNIENMHTIFTGQVAPNPTELLGNARFAALLSHGKKEYDYVMIDCPPLGSVIDAAIVAKQCDGAVIVIASNTVSYKIVQKVKQQLEKADCRILGTVMNKVEIAGKGYYGKYYGKYYGRYYGNYYGEYGNDEQGEEAGSTEK